MKNIVIVAHKFLQQPDDDLISYLNNKKGYNVLHITHSFPDAPDRKSKYSLYKDGVLTDTKESSDFIKFPDLVIYLKEYFYTFKWIISYGNHFDSYIGMDGMCVLAGIFLKVLGNVKKTFFWAMDYVPENRFKGRFGVLKNYLYKKINKISYLKCDEVWDISPRMKEARHKYSGIPENAYKNHRIIPFGVWIDRIRTYSYEECDKHTIVYMGHLLEKQGVQLVIEALPEIAKIYPDIRLLIIGDGSYKEELIKLAERLGVINRCDFLGMIPNHKKLEETVAKCAIAVAPYIKELDTWTYYADPGKVKVYLACGVPVVMTDLPWNAKEIELSACGLVTPPEPGAVRDSICKLLKSETNNIFRNNARTYSYEYSYLKIFDSIENLL